RTVSDLAFDGRLESSPEIPWVFTHGGGALPLLSERIELLRGLLAADGSTTIPEQAGRLWFDMAGTPFPDQVPALAAALGTERLLYGSDYCWTPAPATAL
ncbi:MAG: putative hydrolase, partial [Modestobacter sp.]|nr:putative hydrolase [Modestobacter sp.]